MLLKMQVGHWHSGMAVKMDDTGLKWLDGLGNGRRVTVSVLEDRTVIVSSDAEGHVVGSHDIGRAEDYPYISKRSPVEVDISRFELLELAFLTREHPGRLYARLPEDHLLPWPRFIVSTVCVFDPQELVVTELERRMVSKLRAERRSREAQRLRAGMGCAPGWAQGAPSEGHDLAGRDGPGEG
jgi:hypothetical protein